MQLRLFIPEGPLCELGQQVLQWLEQARRSQQVEIVYDSVDHNLAEQLALFGSARRPAPYLEVLVGGEMACMLHSRGADMLPMLHDMLGARKRRNSTFPPQRSIESSAGG
jgi:hypothetical protein